MYFSKLIYHFGKAEGTVYVLRGTLAQFIFFIKIICMLCYLSDKCLMAPIVIMNNDKKY